MKKFFARTHLDDSELWIFGVMGLFLFVKFGLSYVGWILLAVGACLVGAAGINWLADSLEPRLRSWPYRIFGLLVVAAAVLIALTG